jgi:hypothetical protein
MAGDTEVKKLLDRGILEPSISPYGTSNVLVPKKPLPDGTPGGLRVTAYMRAVNSVTVGDAFKNGGHWESSGLVGTEKRFSAVNLRDGYWNVRLAKDSRPYTAVKTGQSFVQYTRMTIGLKNAGAFFQRLMNKIYDGLKGESLQAYLDDVLVGSNSVVYHVRDVREMLKRTRDANLRLKFSKCAFGKDEVAVLGHKVSQWSVQPSDHHRECIRVFAEPTKVTELSRFLGVLQYFGNHIYDLADMAAPLYDVLTGTAWNKKKPRRKVIELQYWDNLRKEAQHEAFLRLREVLADPGFLVAAREGARKLLCTDASRYGIGGVLLQQEDTGRWLPVGFVSGKLKVDEPRYTRTERENLGVVFGLRKFCHNVYGEPFEVVTDHISLTWLMSLRDPNDRLLRWIV